MKHNKEYLKRDEWTVREVPLSVVQNMVERYHYTGGGSNTATYRHGLFFNNDEEQECFGVAWWIPPTKSAAKATYPENWQGVLALSRLAINPLVPTNGASFLLAKSVKLIDRDRWPCLVTYADEMMGHSGQIYKATNWEYRGKTAPEACFVKDGRVVARKAGPKTRTKQEMLDMGCEFLGRFSKHKYVNII